MGFSFLQKEVKYCYELLSKTNQFFNNFLIRPVERSFT